jgi:hypothetical protein
MADHRSDYKNKVINALTNKGVAKKCPMCNLIGFHVHEDRMAPRLVHDVNEAAQPLLNSQRALPVAVLTCNNCGFVAQFSLKTIGLLDTFTQERSDD